jgi:N6-L-threonylcarbamoyladenine synthase
VVPEVAARKQSEILPILIHQELGRTAVAAADCIAVTAGPGLVTSLMVGVQTAKTLSYALSKPLIGINHIEGHIYANFISNPSPPPLSKGRWSGKSGPEGFVRFPILCLVVSGGHTQLILMKKLLNQTFVEKIILKMILPNINGLLNQKKRIKKKDLII